MTLTLDNPVVGAVNEWWRELHPDPDNPKRRPGNRGACASLRRCTGVLDALLEPETHQLVAKVMRSDPDSNSSGDHGPRLALLAPILARVKPAGHHDARSPSFAEALGLTDKGVSPKESDRPRLSPTRFGALLRSARDEDAFARALRRAIAHLNNAPFDVRRFICDVLNFDDSARRRWTFDYYGTRAAAGGTTTSFSKKETS